MRDRVVDSSAWIELLADSTTYRAMREKFPEREHWLVPDIVVYEVARWLAREKGEDDFDGFLAFTETCRIVFLDASLAVQSALISAQHKLAMADAIIYATCLAYDADLLTCDAHFHALPNVEYVKKRSAQ